MDKLTWYQRPVLWLAKISGLAAVTAYPVGTPLDGVNTTVLAPAGSNLDKSWNDHQNDIVESLKAWRANPLARRLIGLITAYCVGDGINLSSTYKPLNRFITEFWHHDQNNIDLELPEWSDELSRAGELFLTLHTNPADGMSYIRPIPASVIDKIHWQEGDYKTELRYHQMGSSPMDLAGQWWISPDHPEAADITKPLMLHFAINRPIGVLRGESDLAPILPWLRRYSRWLEDRVRMNAGVRSFLWVIYAAKNKLAEITQKYAGPPEPGSIVVAEKDAEEWQAVAPNLHASDAANDGRAIRWMIVSGGPGTALIDLGEGEDANLATGQVMGEMRRRFMRRRQRYLSYLLTRLILVAYERQRSVIKSHRRACTAADIVVQVPDISPDDNAQLGNAAKALTDSMTNLANIVGFSEQFRRFALRLFIKFIGEQLSDQEFDQIITQGKTEPDGDEASQPNKSGNAGPASNALVGAAGDSSRTISPEALPDRAAPGADQSG